MRRLVLHLAVGAILVTATNALADEPAACRTAYEQSQDLRDKGSLIEARKLLVRCSSSDCAGFVQTDCTQWLAGIEGRIPSVVFGAKDGDGTHLRDIRVLADGMEVATTLDGHAVELDPGPHTFVFEARDGHRVELQAVVAEGTKAQHVDAAFPAPAEPREPQPVTPPPNISPSRSTPVAPASSTVSTRVATTGTASHGSLRPVGAVMVALGVIGIGAGAFFGVRAMSKQSDAHCDNNVCANDADASTLRDARAAGNVSTALFIGGAVFAATGGILWFLGGRHRDVGLAIHRPAPLGGPAQ